MPRVPGRPHWLGDFEDGFSADRTHIFLDANDCLREDVVFEPAASTRVANAGFDTTAV